MPETIWRVQTVARTGSAAVLALLIAGVTMAHAGAQAQSGGGDPPLGIGVTTVAPRIDGGLDEQGWKAAPVSRHLSADPGKGSADSTDVRVLADDRALYFGFSCRDAQPNGIRAEGDPARQFGDDRVTVEIQTGGPERRTLRFSVNPNGLRAGSLTGDPLWQAAAQRSADGWTAEIEVPFSLLNQRPTDRAFQVSYNRYQSRTQVWSRWVEPPSVASEPVRALAPAVQPQVASEFLPLEPEPIIEVSPAVTEPAEPPRPTLVVPGPAVTVPSAPEMPGAAVNAAAPDDDEAAPLFAMNLTSAAWREVATTATDAPGDIFANIGPFESLPAPMEAANAAGQTTSTPTDVPGVPISTGAPPEASQPQLEVPRQLVAPPSPPVSVPSPPTTVPPPPVVPPAPAAPTFTPEATRPREISSDPEAPRAAVNALSAAVEAPLGIYRLQPGDMLQIKHFNNPELNELLPIRPDGRISLELVGEVRAADLSSSQLEEALMERYGPLLRKPDVSVIVKDFGGNKVYVGGEVNRPGVLRTNGTLTLVQALVEAGGWTRSAELRSVVILRNRGTDDPLFLTVNLREGLQGDSRRADLLVQPYDIIFVPKTRISRMAEFVAQYINDILPLPVTLGISYALERAIRP